MRAPKWKQWVVVTEETLRVPNGTRRAIRKYEATLTLGSAERWAKRIRKQLIEVGRVGEAACVQVWSRDKFDTEGPKAWTPPVLAAVAADEETRA